jgi:hypothetical protein
LTKRETNVIKEIGHGNAIYASGELFIIEKGGSPKY